MLWLTVYGNRHAVLFQDSSPLSRPDLRTDEERPFDPTDTEFWRGPLEAFRADGAFWIERSGEAVHLVEPDELAPGFLPGPGGVPTEVLASGDGGLPSIDSGDLANTPP